jgi:DNA-binding transcriptional regulator YbjK
VTETSDRRSTLADAAVDLLAEQGMRGLTHRAVDTRAGVAQGSTSAYFRTRTALIEAVVRRLLELDQQDMTSYRLHPADIGFMPEQVAAALAVVVDRLLGTGRNRTLARYHCFLEATHRPELRELLRHGLTLREQAAGMLALLGAADPSARGRDLVAFLDGLLFDRIAGSGALTAAEPGTPASIAELTSAIHAALRGVLR